MAALLSLASCQKESEAGCFTSTGPVVMERRALPPFRVLSTYDNVQVTLVQDTETYAEVRAGKNLQEDIRLEVKDNHLSIRNTSRCNWIRRYNTPREVTLHTPRLTDLFLLGQADIRTAGVFRVDTLSAHLVGAGDYHLNLQSRYLNLDQFELGDIYLEGQTEELHLIVGGGGSTYATGLPAQRVYLRTNADSEGSTHLTASELLVGTHAGVGTVYYRGTATATLQVTGKGKLVKE